MIATDESNDFLADTNILIYAHDPEEARKHERAKALLMEGMERKRLVLSVQVMNEFYSVMTRSNRSHALPHAEAAAVIHDLSRTCRVLPLIPETTL